MLTFSRRLGCTARHLSAQSDTCRRLGCVAKHLRCAAKRAVVSAAGDGDGGSGGNPRDALVITERGGIEYLNPMGSTAEKSATPFSRVTRAGGMVYGARCDTMVRLRQHKIPNQCAAWRPAFFQSLALAPAVTQMANPVLAQQPRKLVGHLKISSKYWRTREVALSELSRCSASSRTKSTAWHCSAALTVGTLTARP